LALDWVCELCIICLQVSQLPLDFFTPPWQLHGVGILDSIPLELHLSWLYSLVIGSTILKEKQFFSFFSMSFGFFVSFQTKI
jgi:hypothetical protein